MNETEKTLVYIKKKVPKEIAWLSHFLGSSKLAVFLITRKNAGKSTYIGLLSQLFPEQFVTIAAGDLVRSAAKELKTGGELKETIEKAFPGKPEYLETIRHFSLKRLLPNQLIEFLIERALAQSPQGKSLFVDGFPRAPKQLTFTEKFVKQLQKRGYKTLFLQIEVAEEVLRERRLSRRVCPHCGAIGNMTGIKGGKVDYDPEKNEFFLRCERPECAGARMVRKAGYEEETKELEGRDDLLLETAALLKEKYPQDYIFLRSDLPVSEFHGEDKELNHLTLLSFRNGKIIQEEKRKTVNWNGKEVYELHPRGVLPIIIKEVCGKLKV